MNKYLYPTVYLSADLRALLKEVNKLLDEINIKKGDI